MAALIRSIRGLVTRSGTVDIGIEHAQRLREFSEMLRREGDMAIPHGHA